MWVKAKNTTFNKNYKEQLVVENYGGRKRRRRTEEWGRGEGGGVGKEDSKRANVLCWDFFSFR